MLSSWWIAAFPGVAILVPTLVIDLMGDARSAGGWTRA
jgi:ABC-type dipeptide/oligopeptide/nickel transport system permease subunit